jgi:hypothetical protein
MFKKTRVPVVSLKVCLLLCFVLVNVSQAGIQVMNDDELAKTDAQFSKITLESFYQANDTVRIFLDLHQEIYGTIDTIKAGYYYRSSDQMRTNMAQIGSSGFEGFYDVQAYNNGANFNFAKITSDFNTLAPQGGDTFEPWGNGGYSASDPEGTLTPNTNNYDWDIWMDNIRMGESPDKPLYMNGQIIRLEFDGNLTDNTPDHLRRIIIGTNDQQGNFYSNFQRYTGIANPMLLAHTAARSLGVADPYSYTPGTMQMVRDTYIQCFGINVFNVEDRDTGFWVVMNFTGNNIGYELITGLPENAIDFSYTQGLKDIPLYDPDWSPYANGPMTDPYSTATQVNSHNQGP